MAAKLGISATTVTVGLRRLGLTAPKRKGQGIVITPWRDKAKQKFYAHCQRARHKAWQRVFGETH